MILNIKLIVMERKTSKSMGKKLFLGALCGWVGAFLLVCIIAGEFPDSLEAVQWLLFISLAPGAIIGIIVTYIVNKSSNSNTPLVQQETREERLTKLKALLDQDVLTKEEFEEQKKRILED